METDTQPVAATTEGDSGAAEQPVAKPTAVDSTPTPPATPDWQTEIEKADAKALRNHPKIAGIVGGDVQRAIQQERERNKTEEAARANREAEERLRQLAEQDPETFAQQWIGEKQKADLEARVSGLRDHTRQELAAAIGSGLRDLPEWKDVTPEDQDALARALVGKKDDEVLPIFQKAALDLLATKRAKNMLAEWQKTELAKEREAVRTEEAAKLLRGSDAPDMTKAKNGPAGINIASMSDKEFDDYWKRQYGR